MGRHLGFSGARRIPDGGAWPLEFGSYDACSPLQYRMGVLEHRPVAAFLLYLGTGAAALHSVATIPAVRRRDIASVLATAGRQDARGAGGHTAVLTASDEARKLYAQLGFCPCGDVVRLESPQPARAAPRHGFLYGVDDL